MKLTGHRYTGWYDVAPRAGAWIETRLVAVAIIIVASRPARARGLKLTGHRYTGWYDGRAPRGRVD